MHIADRLGNFVANNPKKIIAIFAVIFLLALPFLSQLYIYINVYELSPDKPYLDDFKILNAELGWDNWGFVMCLPQAASDVTQPKAVREINAVCDRLEELEWVESTVSLAMLVKYARNMAGLGYTFPEEGTVGDMQIRAALQIILSQMGDVAYGNVLGKNKDWTLIVVIMRKGESGEQYREWQRQLLSYGLELDKSNPYADQLTMYPMSMDIIYSTLDDAAVQEGPIWIGAAIIAGAISIFWLFRKKADIFISMLVMIFVVAVALAVLVLTGVHFNLLSMVLIAAIFGCGIDYCLHTIARYKEERALGKSSKDSANQTIRSLGTPLFIMASSTTGGFASIYFCQIQAIGALGVILGVSIFFAFLTSIIFIPAVIELFARRKMRIQGIEDTTATKEEVISWLEAQLRRKQRLSPMGRLGSFVIKHSKAVAVLFVASILVLSVPLITPGPQVWGGSYITAYTPAPVERGIFPEDNYAMKVLRLVDRTMGIPNEIVVMIKGDMTDRSTLIMAKEMQSKLDGKVHGWMKTDSVLNVLKVYFSLRPNEDSNGDGIPDGDIRATYDAIFNDPALGVLMTRVLTRDYRISAIRLGCNPQPSNSLGSDMDNYWKTRRDTEKVISDMGANAQQRNVRLSSTGLIVLGTEVGNSIIVGNSTAMYLMFVVVFLIVFFFWRRVSLSLLAMIPITTAIFVQYSVTAMLGYEITYISLILTAMVMGIGVDDAVHLISRMREEINRGKTPEEAAVLANAVIGRVLVATTATTVAPFIPIMWSIVLWGNQTAHIVLPALLGGELFVTVCILPVILVWHARHFPKAWLYKGNTLEKIAQMRKSFGAMPGIQESGTELLQEMLQEISQKEVPAEEEPEPKEVTGKGAGVKIKKRAGMKK